MNTKNVPCGAQQGDVLFLPPIASLPHGCKLKVDGILVRGEATGHAHRLADATDGLLYESPNWDLYLVAGARGATTIHEEHGPVTRPAGIYPIRRTQEYDHFAQAARRVTD